MCPDVPVHSARMSTRHAQAQWGSILGEKNAQPSFMRQLLLNVLNLKQRQSPDDPNLFSCSYQLSLLVASNTRSLDHCDPSRLTACSPSQPFSRHLKLVHNHRRCDLFLPNTPTMLQYPDQRVLIVDRREDVGAAVALLREEAAAAAAERRTGVDHREEAGPDVSGPSPRHIVALGFDTETQ